MPRFQGARPDHVRVESSSCCSSRELESFVRPGQGRQRVLTHGTRHVLLQSENVFELGGVTIVFVGAERCLQMRKQPVDVKIVRKHAHHALKCPSSTNLTLAESALVMGYASCAACDLNKGQQLLQCKMLLAHKRPYPGCFEPHYESEATYKIFSYEN